MGAAWSGWTDLANHPYSAWGTVLSPSSAPALGFVGSHCGPGTCQYVGVVDSNQWTGVVHRLVGSNRWIVPHGCGHRGLFGVGGPLADVWIGRGVRGGHHDLTDSAGFSGVDAFTARTRRGAWVEVDTPELCLHGLDVA